jgi:alkanesulfonate monooxygenase SsuD/methylene tetrahydromethanopterin reductase-like flavin-dependent oxidoreductase (luciferase family)
MEAERLGMEGAYFRVHHFARQLASPFPLLAAIGAKTRRIEIGTAVIDMRYENPHYMAEDAGAADLIAGGRLQLGISRGSPEQVIDGWRYFGHRPVEGEDDAGMGRRHAQEFLELLGGKGFAQPNPHPMFPNPPGLLRLEPHAEGLGDRIWWGAASNATAAWAAKLGMNLQSSTLKFDETGEPLHIQQAAQIRAFRAAWKEAGHVRTPRISVSRSIFALIDDRDRFYFGRGGQEQDQIGYLDKTTRAIFGRGYAAEPDVLIEQLRKDEALAAADTAPRHTAWCQSLYEGSYGNIHCPGPQEIGRSRPAHQNASGHAPRSMYPGCLPPRPSGLSAPGWHEPSRPLPSVPPR